VVYCCNKKDEGPERLGDVGAKVGVDQSGGLEEAATKLVAGPGGYSFAILRNWYTSAIDFRLVVLLTGGRSKCSTPLSLLLLLSSSSSSSSSLITPVQEE
jgi:hypothetical protein